MCPLCAVGMTTWLVAGGAGSGALLTTTWVLARARSKKAISGQKKVPSPGKSSAKK